MMIPIATDEDFREMADWIASLGSENAKYSEDQPRVPAGSDHGGEFGSTVQTELPGIATTPSAWYQSLTEEEFLAGEFYKGTGYKSMNPALRGQKEMSALMEKRIKLIDSALSKGALPKDKTLFRMAPLSALSGLEVGSEFTDNGFISTSMKKNFAGDYRHKKQTQVFEIRAKAGQRGGYADQLWRTGRDHTYLNPNLKENEFILPRGTRFRVSRTWAGNDKAKHVELEVIDSGN